MATAEIAKVKISQLTEDDKLDVPASTWFVIFDATESKTKKVSLQNLISSIQDLTHGGGVLKITTQDGIQIGSSASGLTTIYGGSGNDIVISGKVLSDKVTEAKTTADTALTAAQEAMAAIVTHKSTSSEKRNYGSEHQLASELNHGFMSSGDKKDLNAIVENGSGNISLKAYNGVGIQKDDGSISFESIKDNNFTITGIDAKANTKGIVKLHSSYTKNPISDSQIKVPTAETIVKMYNELKTDISNSQPDVSEFLAFDYYIKKSFFGIFWGVGTIIKGQITAKITNIFKSDDGRLYKGVDENHPIFSMFVTNNTNNISLSIKKDQDDQKNLVVSASNAVQENVGFSWLVFTIPKELPSTTPDVTVPNTSQTKIYKYMAYAFADESQFQFNLHQNAKNIYFIIQGGGGSGSSGGYYNNQNYTGAGGGSGAFIFGKLDSYSDKTILVKVGKGGKAIQPGNDQLQPGVDGEDSYICFSNNVGFNKITAQGGKGGTRSSPPLGGKGGVVYNSYDKATLLVRSDSSASYVIGNDGSASSSVMSGGKGSEYGLQNYLTIGNSMFVIGTEKTHILELNTTAITYWILNESTSSDIFSHATLPMILNKVTIKKNAGIWTTTYERALGGNDDRESEDGVYGAGGGGGSDWETNVIGGNGGNGFVWIYWESEQAPK